MITSHFQSLIKPSNYDIRLDQASIITNQVITLKSQGYSTILLMGDFNDNTHSKVYSLLVQELYDLVAINDYTYIYKGRRKRLDGIFAWIKDKSVESFLVDGYALHINTNSKLLSDHDPLIAQIVV